MKTNGLSENRARKVFKILEHLQYYELYSVDFIFLSFGVMGFIVEL